MTNEWLTLQERAQHFKEEASKAPDRETQESEQQVADKLNAKAHKLVEEADKERRK